MEYLTSSEVAELWGIGKCRVDRLAREGRIEGAELFGKSWMIPRGAQKPADRRTREGKSASQTEAFRFPLFVNAPADSFAPPLNNEELILRQVQLDYYACNFTRAKKSFDNLANQTESIYIRIIALFYLCSLSVEVYGGENFSQYFNRLQLELSKDFPNKKEMSLVTPWLHTIMVELQAVSDALNIDPLYDYSHDVQPLISYLTAYHLAKDSPSTDTLFHLDVYEILCQQFQQSGHYYEACELHFLLFLAYFISMQKEAMLHHLRKGLALAQDHKFYIIAASYESYHQGAFDIVLKEMPEDFSKLIRHNSNIINKSIGKFSEKELNSILFTTLSKDDYRYLMLAFQGHSNKDVALALHLSERTVAAHYAIIYEKLGVKNKRELVELVLASTR